MPTYTPTANITPGGQILAADVLTLYSAINGGLDVTNIVAQGLTGAAIANSSINVPLLKSSGTAFGIQQAAAKHFGGGYFSLTSGSYSFWPGLSTDAGVGTIGSIGGNTTADGVADFDVANKGGIARVQANQTAQAIIWLAVLNATNVATNQAFLTSYYLQTSPPYDLGDGEIPVFVFVLVDKNGDAKMTFVSQDPPWAVGPRKRLNTASIMDTIQTPNQEVRKNLDGSVVTLLQNHLEQLDSFSENWQQIVKMKRQFHQSNSGDRIGMAQDIARLESMVMTQLEDTQDEKNRNMATTPHPFIHNDLIGGGVFDTSAPLTAVMLDPMSKETCRLALLHESGENVCALLHNGYIKIDSTHISERSGPKNVMIASHDFKNSKG